MTEYRIVATNKKSNHPNNAAMPEYWKIRLLGYWMVRILDNCNIRMVKYCNTIILEHEYSCWYDDRNGYNDKKIIN